MSAFGDLTVEIQHGSDWYAQWLESLHTLRRTRPEGFDLFAAYYTTLAGEAAELGQAL